MYREGAVDCSDIPGSDCGGRGRSNSGKDAYTGGIQMLSSMRVHKEMGPKSPVDRS